MDRASYQACITSLWSVVEHIRAIDLAEVGHCAKQYGTADERRMVEVLRRMSRHVPPEPTHRR